jgi:hypothetical protein
VEIKARTRKAEVDVAKWLTPGITQKEFLESSSLISSSKDVSFTDNEDLILVEPFDVILEEEESKGSSTD